jgi:histidinol dehydrogenase
MANATPLLSRVQDVEQRVAEGREEDKVTFMPKLAELKDRIQTFEDTYESRLAEVQERNRQALENLTKLQERVTRRANAKAELEARAAAQRAAEEALLAQQAAEAKKKPRSRRGSKALAAPVMPQVSAADMQVLMQAVGLQVPGRSALPMETPVHWPRCAAPESPYVPISTPECWDDSRSLLCIRPVAAM